MPRFVRHNKMEIPHGLAAVAAAVCLSLAFTSDFQSRLEAMQVEMEPESAVEIIVHAPDDNAPDLPTSSEPTRSKSSDQPTTELSNFLLPWLPRLRQGG